MTTIANSLPPAQRQRPEQARPFPVDEIAKRKQD